MRVIIISDSREYMGQIRRMVAGLMIHAEVTEYDPEDQGQPGPEFDWSVYDLLMIQDRLRGSERGLAWLAVFNLYAKMPPAIMIAEKVDTFISEKITEMPSTEQILREDLNEESLSNLLDKLEVTQGTRSAARTLANMAFKNDTEIVRRLSGGDPEHESDEYKFVRLIGQGAQSRVYLAERHDDQQTLVLKVLDLDAIDDVSAVQRFAREAELIASIDSPYVIKFFDHGLPRLMAILRSNFLLAAT